MDWRLDVTLFAAVVVFGFLGTVLIGSVAYRTEQDFAQKCRAVGGEPIVAPDGKVCVKAERIRLKDAQ